MQRCILLGNTKRPWNKSDCIFKHSKRKRSHAKKNQNQEWRRSQPKETLISK